MRIAIFGAGAVGGYFGARLQAAGAKVHFIARGAHLAAMRAHGLRVLSPAGDLHLTTMEASDDPAAIGPVDTVILAVKLTGLEAAAKACAPLLGRDTLALTIQNGVEAAGIAGAALGRTRVAAGIAYIFVEVEAPGIIRHKGERAKLVFGAEDDGVRNQLTALGEALREAGAEAELSYDITRDLWLKLGVLAPVAGMTSLARQPVGVVRSVPALRGVVHAALAEVVAVGRARGVALPVDTEERLKGMIDSLPEDGRSSMQNDLAAGRPLELAWINGAIARLGAETGVATPVNQVIEAALLPYACGAA